MLIGTSVSGYGKQHHLLSYETWKQPTCLYVLCCKSLMSIEVRNISENSCSISILSVLEFQEREPKIYYVKNQHTQKDFCFETLDEFIFAKVSTADAHCTEAQKDANQLYPIH